MPTVIKETAAIPIISDAISVSRRRPGATTNLVTAMAMYSTDTAMAAPIAAPAGGRPASGMRTANEMMTSNSPTMSQLRPVEVVSAG